MTQRLTSLICTHNRADLLDRVLASLNAAKRPAMPIQILVATNDETGASMQAYQASQIKQRWLPLRLIEVPTPGKSHALNRAIPEIDTGLTAFVDDDHRVDENHLVAIEQAAQTWWPDAGLSWWPDAGLYCGRILPDWDGSEPEWVHHKVEAFHLTRRYFRRWRFQTSRNIAQSRGFAGERRIFNIPLFVFPQLLRADLHMEWGHLNQSRDEVFNREIIVFHFPGLIQGLYQAR